MLAYDHTILAILVNALVSYSIRRMESRGEDDPMMTKDVRVLHLVMKCLLCGRGQWLFCCFCLCKSIPTFPEIETIT